MSIRIWRGDAQARANVWYAKPSGVKIGDSFLITINSKSITFVATAATAANVVSGLVAAVGVSTIPEWQEVTATSGTDIDGEPVVVLTGPSDGKPITVSGSAVNGAAGVSVIETRKGVAGVNEKQQVSLPPASGGTFTLSYLGTASAAIAYNASAATVQTDLEGIAAIGAGQVSVSGVDGGPWTVTFIGSLAATAVPLLVGNGASLVLSAPLVITETVKGAPAVNQIDTITVTGANGTDMVLLVSGYTSSTNIPASFPASTMQAILAAVVGSGNVSVTGPDHGPFVAEWIGSKSGTAVSISAVSGCTVTNTQAASGTGVNEEQTVAVLATAGTFTLTYSGYTTAGQSYAVTAANLKTALEGLTSIGVGNVDVSLTGTTYTVTFKGTLAATDLALMTGSGASLTGGPVYVAIIQTAVAAVNEVQTVALLGSPTAGTFTLTYGANTTTGQAYNISAANLQTTLRALGSIGGANVNVSGVDGGPWTVTFVGTLAGTDVNLMTGSGSGLTVPGTQACTVTEVTTGLGPNWFSDANNWSGITLPINGDTIVFEAGSVDCLYGLAQSSLAPAILDIRASYTGKIGLAPKTDTGYYEYRNQYLAIGPGTIYVGQGDGSGSGRLKIDTGATQTAVTVYATGAASDSGYAPLLWKGTHASNALTVYKGDVGIAVIRGEVATLSTLYVGYTSSQASDSEVTCGDGTTLGTVIQEGGMLVVGGKSTTAITSLTVYAGEATIRGTDGVTALVVRGGTVYYDGTGTLGGNPVVSGDGTLDFSGTFDAKTVTNPIDVYGDDASVIDPFVTVSNLRLDWDETTRVANIGRNIRITRGTVA